MPIKIYPVFIPMRGCPFCCIYCNQYAITGQDGIETEIKALTAKYEEIAFYGGTFTFLPLAEQRNYLDLARQKLTPTGRIRISTRPDAINEGLLDFLWENNVRTIELGVQSFCDEVLTATQRGYTAQVAKKSCLLILRRGFRLCIQLMPGLPGETKRSLCMTVRDVLRINPQFVRIYPVIVLKNTQLASWWEAGKYSPLSLTEAVKISAYYKQCFEKQGIRIIKTGLHGDIRQDQIKAGPYHENFGELVAAWGLLRFLRRKAKVGEKFFLESNKANLLNGNKKIMATFFNLFFPCQRAKVIVDRKGQSAYFIIEHKNTFLERENI